MSLESDLFERKRPDFDKLLKYGFVKTVDEYTYRKDLDRDDMYALITVDRAGHLSGKVMDGFADEEYVPVHLQVQTGSYVADIRSRYLLVLEEIAKACFHEVPYIFDQTIRISEFIERELRVKGRSPFSKHPSFIGYYHPISEKWFGLVMDVDRSVITNDTGKCEVLNLKVPKDQMAELLAHDHIYPGYHMSNKSWISIIMDDSLDDEIIQLLVSQSYGLAEGSSPHKNTSEWIIPANPKYFDVDHAFRQSDLIYWKQSSKVHVGDLVYMYYGAPFSEIRYLCRVEETDIPYNDPYSGPVRISKMMRIRKLYYFKHNLLDRKLLARFGVTTVRGPRYMPEDLKKEIERLHPKKKEGEE